MTKHLKLLILLVVLVFPFVQNWTALEILKLKTFDALVEDKEPSGYFSILNITEKDVEREGGYPFPRRKLADIQNDLINCIPSRRQVGRR